MSITICFVARTGVVLGTDSRVTTTSSEGDTREDAYPKLVQFGRAPIALAMVGVGAYGGRDFRSLIAETYHDWCAAVPAVRGVEQVARAFAETAGRIARESGPDRGMSVLVAGFSPGEAFGELWEVELPSGDVTNRAASGSQTFLWRGQSDAVKTLWWGANLSALTDALSRAGVPEEQAARVLADVKASAAWGPERINWGMPLRSAVDLVRFQLDLQIESERFMPGRARCGAPIQVVAINDAGLRWMDQPFAEFASVGCSDPDPSW